MVYVISVTGNKFDGFCFKLTQAVHVGGLSLLEAMDLSLYLYTDPFHPPKQLRPAMVIWRDSEVRVGYARRRPFAIQP